MLRFAWPFSKTETPRILCIGAHSDDIEIGCGGTLLRLLNKRTDCHVDWIVFSSIHSRRKEAHESARLFLKEAGTRKIAVHSYRDGFFPYQGAKIKEEFERIKRTILPDLIFTHYRHDLHQDHRLLNELTWNTFRNHSIFEYEIPKYDGDLGSPNVFVELSDAFCRKKIDFLLRVFDTQRRKHWFTRETFQSLLRLRGMEANASSRYAEAFYVRKLVL